MARQLRGVIPVSVTRGLYREPRLGKGWRVLGRLDWRVGQGVTCGVVTDTVTGAKLAEQLADGGHAQAAVFAQLLCGDGAWGLGQDLKDALLW